MTACGMGCTVSYEEVPDLTEGLRYQAFRQEILMFVAMILTNSWFLFV
jgi:hypothetical protein